MVFSATPSFVDLLPAGGIKDGQIPADFPTNRIRSQQSAPDLQLSQERGRRLAAPRYYHAAVVRHALGGSHLQFIGVGGVDYFQQDNNLVSPPELQFEPDDGQPGTVVLSKSSNRNLNAALNLTHTLNPSATDQGTQWTTSAGIQYEERRLYATQILGRTLLAGQESPQQTTSQTVSSRIEPVRDLGIFGQEEVLLADRRLLLTAGLRADRSSSNGNTGKYLLLSQARGLVPVS